MMHTTTYQADLESKMPKVLLVDDHADIRRLVRITLGKTFEVLEAEDGTTALEIVRLQKPDLVVLDIMMPGALDGLQVLDAIKTDASLSATRVIMVTARGQAKDYEYGMQLGADAYFIKPFSPLQLVASIKEILAR
jgi:DNA-binding response OmpR family regulator